ncbi:MAG: UvrD-helicase domain-containing protein [Thermoguttaceae bacterium]|nr:UvrD-helicase domain-containing protein [Thermoguttaceae bacterium]
MSSRLFQGLNEPQRKAVAHKDGPLLVLAGPGSGKTRVVTHRIAYLIEQGVAPWNIAALTFTNKAAEEMHARLDDLVPGQRVWIGTFHSFCLWILHRYRDEARLAPNFIVYDTDASKRLIEGLVDRRELPSGCDAGKILAAISWAKNGMILPADYRASEGSQLGKIVEQVYPKYQEALRRANAVDFDDLLVRTALLLKNHEPVRARLDDRFRYMLVDEYQDTNLVQYAIARALSRDWPNLAVTGDPDQSIYGWRGANIRNILEFEKDFQHVTVVRLEENYRSCGSILAVASALIKHNRFRKEKELFTQNRQGPKPRLLSCYNQQEEAELIAAEIAEEIASSDRSPGDYAIFFRMNALSRNLERALRQKGVPFALVRGLEFFSRKEIKDLIAYFQLIYNPDDIVSFERVINLPARGIGKVTVERIKAFAEIHGLSRFAAAKRAAEIPGLSARTRGAILQFTAMIERLAAAADGADMEMLLTLLLQETKYLAMFDTNSEEDKQRIANVQELLSEVREFDEAFDEEESAAALAEVPFWDEEDQKSDRLGRFLEQTALTSDVDALDKSDRVSLMTLHAAKGLEFPVVYIVAVEGNILPHERSLHDKKQMEEERRLLFVGITRAKETLRISRAEYREFRGSYAPTILSPFLYEIPSELLEISSAGTVMQKFRQTGSATAPNGTGLLSDYLAERESDEEDPDPTGDFAAGNGISSFSVSRVGTARRGRRRKGAAFRRTDEDGLTIETNEYCESEPEESVEMVFDDEGNLIPASRRPPKKRAPSALGAIRTGADLVQALPGERTGEKRAARQTGWRKSALGQEPKSGMLLRHPDYGVGFIRRLFGPKSNRVVHVEFMSGAGMVDLPLDDPAIDIFWGKKE